MGPLVPTLETSERYVPCLFAIFTSSKHCENYCCKLELEEVVVLLLPIAPRRERDEQREKEADVDRDQPVIRCPKRGSQRSSVLVSVLVGRGIRAVTHVGAGLAQFGSAHSSDMAKSASRDELLWTGTRR